jgi:trans-aconitate 2-methyltransferase
MSPSNATDWSATQYLQFHNERTRPVHDLVSYLRPLLTATAPRIYDLGCGPGNSTRVLLDAFPGARITGLDSSPDMLSRATASFASQPNVDFVRGDLARFSLPEIDGEADGDGHRGAEVDLLFSNAVFHWLRTPSRIPTLIRLFASLSPGRILALQMPDNYQQPSHSCMRATALLPNKPWSPFFAATRIGDPSDPSRPDLDPIEPAAAYYNALIPHAARVDVWRTEYLHVLADAGAIVEWVKGTGLQPYLNRIGDEGAKRGFLDEYERRLRGAYGELADGKVMLGYPRLFVVAVRK